MSRGMRSGGAAGPGGASSAARSLLWFSVLDYGAVADGVTDNTAAFTAAMRASGAANPYAGGSSGPPFGGTVYVPPGDLPYYFASDLDITREVELMGGGGPDSLHRPTVLQFAAGKGLIIHAATTSPEVDGHGGGSLIYGFRMICSPLTIALRLNLHAYVVGDKVRLVNDNRFYYECTIAGTSAASSPFGADTISDDANDFSPTAGRALFATLADGGVTWVCKAHNAITFYYGATVKEVTVEGATNAGISLRGDSATPLTNTSLSTIEKFQVLNCGIGIMAFGGDCNQFTIRDGLVQNIGALYPTERGGFGLVDASFLGGMWQGLTFEHTGGGCGKAIWTVAGAVGASTYLGCYTEGFRVSYVTGVVIGGDHGAGGDAETSTDCDPGTAKGHFLRG